MKKVVKFCNPLNREKYNEVKAQLDAQKAIESAAIAEERR